MYDVVASLPPPVVLGLALYYLFGFLWLLAGVVEGWCSFRTDEPFEVAVGIAAWSLVWPYMLYRMARDVRAGRRRTRF